jgi:hypothetical protein
MERELREKAQAARERAKRAAREAAAAASRSRPKAERPSDEELGYVKTDDSFGKIIADGLDDVADWLQRHSKRD